jgi:hypothetical protein
VLVVASVFSREDTADTPPDFESFQKRHGATKRWSMKNETGEDLLACSTERDTLSCTRLD